MMLLAYSAILLFSVSLSLVPSESKTIHKNGATHEITKYIMVPQNDYTNQNKLDIATDNSNPSNDENFDNTYKNRFVSPAGNSKNHGYEMYINPGAVYYKGRHGYHNSGTNKVTYNKHNIKNINDNAYGNLNTKRIVTKYRLTYKTNPELTGIRAFNGNNNIFENNHGETSMVDQKDLNSDSLVKSVPLPSERIKTYNVIQQQYKSSSAEYKKDSFDISNSKHVKGTDSTTGNDGEMNSHVMPVSDSDMAVHTFLLPNKRLKTYKLFHKNKNLVQLSNMKYIYLPANEDLPKHYGQNDMQKTNVPERTVKKYHWSFKNQPDGESANKHKIDIVSENDSQLNMQNIILPKTNISTYHWSYNKQLDDVISNNHNNVQFENDGQINVHKMELDKTEKTYHWPFENQATGEEINGNKIDVHVNDLLRDDYGKMNMQKMILQDRDEGTDQWTFDKSNDNIPNHNDYSHNADENNVDMNDALSENDGSIKIQTATVKYIDISTYTAPNTDDSKNEDKDTIFEQTTSNMLSGNGDQEIAGKLPSVLATSTVGITGDRDNEQDIVVKNVVAPELQMNLYLSNTNSLRGTPESVTVTNFEEEPSPAETNKVEIIMPASKAEMLSSSEQNVDSSGPSQTKSLNAETDSLNTISDSSDGLHDKLNEYLGINNPLDGTTQSMVISGLGFKIESLLDPEYTSSNADHQLDTHETLPESTEESEDDNKSEHIATLELERDQKGSENSSVKHFDDDIQDNDGVVNLSLFYENIPMHPEGHISSNANSIVNNKVIDKLRNGDSVAQSRWFIPKLNYMKHQIQSNIKENPVQTGRQIIGNVDTENKEFNVLPKISYTNNQIPDTGRIGDYYTDLQDHEYGDIKPLNIDEYEVPCVTLKESAAGGLELYRNTPNSNSISNNMDEYKLIKGSMLDQLQTQNINYNNYYENKLNSNFPYPVKVSSELDNPDLYFKEPHHLLHGTYTVPTSSPYYSLLIKSYPLLAQLLNNNFQAIDNGSFDSQNKNSNDKF